MNPFTSFTAVAPVAPASLERWADAVPAPVAELWRDAGTGLIGDDGFVRVIDPAQYADDLSDWFTNADGAVPFLATGLGDLFIWKEPVIRHVLYRTGEVRGIEPEFDSWWPLLENPDYLDRHLDRGDYPAAAQRLGVPGITEAFFYVPFLMVGGAPGPQNLQRGELAVSLGIFTQLVGPAEL